MSGNRTVFVSGCHVCPSIMAKPPTNRKVLAPPLIQWAQDNDIDIVPMRCPETEFVGSERQPKGRAYYNKLPGFRDHCKVIAEFEAKHMLVVGGVIGVIGITTSPACGTNFNGKNPYQPSGIFMEELRSECESWGLSPLFISIWPKHPNKMTEKLENILMHYQNRIGN